ncbi:MAG TPA: DUF86 domain-containing protein [bacterium]|nr:DUF86 domain-containing protein [bacterium]
MRDVQERLRDMLEAIAAIERHAGGTKAEFECDERLQVWFVYHLQIIGEAARGLPREVQTLAPDIPWGSIIGMRNILVHGYFDIDADLVWDTVKRDIPALKPKVEALLERLKEQGYGR